MSSYSDLHYSYIQVIKIVYTETWTLATMAIKELHACVQGRPNFCNRIRLKLVYTNQSVASEPDPPMVARSVKLSQTPEKAVQGWGHI